MNEINNCVNDGSDIMSVFREVQTDLFNSLIICYEGYYRQAYIGLRSSLELLLSFLYYYDNRYDFILWKNDKIDMTWTQLISQDKGIFNNTFLSIVNNETINVDFLLEEFKELYHTTSQYVHGKYDYMQKSLMDQVNYSEQLIKDYFIVCKKIIKAELIILYIRFKPNIQEKLGEEEKLKLEPMIKKYEVDKNE